MPNSEPNLDESGEPIRLGRTPGGFTQVGGGFGGGGGGVGGGGGGFGGGGLGFAFAPGGLGGSGMAGLRERRRKGFIPGVTPGAPQPSDTVPAMLTPGEIVMNNGVTSDPQLARALMALNMAGAQRMMATEPQGYAFGGMALMNPMTMVMRNQATQGFAFGGKAQSKYVRTGPTSINGYDYSLPPLKTQYERISGPVGGPMMAAHEQTPLTGLSRIMANLRGMGQNAQIDERNFERAIGPVVQASVPKHGRDGIIRIIEKELVDDPETYSESAKGLIINTQRALREIRKHGHGDDMVEEFFKDFGRGGEYDAYKLLEWLGYAYGGVVPQPQGFAFGGMAGRALSRGAQQRAPMPGMAYGGFVPGFALGGMAGFGGGSSSTFDRMRGMAGNMPQAPAGSPQRLTGGTSSGDAATMTNGRYATTDPNKNSKDYWRDAQGTVRDRNGNVYSYNPNNQWESYTGSYNPGPQGMAQRLIGQFGQAGYFDPEGNRALMDSVRAEALSNARATQQGAALRAQLAGMDPGAAASYRMEAGLRGSGDVARALNAARLQSMLQQQQLANAMLREDQGFGYGLTNALQQGNLQNRNAAEADKRANSGGFMGGLGQLVGAGVGSMFGPAGTALGTAAGKKLFG